MADEKVGADFIKETLANFVKSIEIDSNFTDKPWIINDPFVDTGKPSTTDAAMKLAQPMITLRFEGGGSYTVAPNGKPTRKKEIGAYKTLAMVGGGLAAALGMLLLLGRKK